MNDDEEIKRLLDIRFEELEELDLWSQTADDGKDPLNEIQKAFGDLRHIPGGAEGLSRVAGSRAVKEMERALSQPLSDGPSGEALASSITQLPVSERTRHYKSKIKLDYEKAVLKIEAIYKSIRKGQQIKNDVILNIVEYFMSVFIKDRCILLNMCQYRHTGNDYLFNHMLQVCLVAINIATACGYSRRQVLETGEAGLLADIGMLLISDNIRTHPKKLSGDELFDIHKHPMVGLYALEKIEGIPQAVAITAYQHHERISGNGYPKNRKGTLTHSYSRIIAVADVYQALCSHREYRKALFPHDAMVRVVKMSKLKMLDADIVSSFLHYVSLYPVGSFVRLSNGCTARVVQPNEADFKSPVVSILSDEHGNFLPEEKVTQLDLVKSKRFSITEALELRVKPDNIMMGF